MTDQDQFEVKQGQWWMFVGNAPMDGRQTKHMVVGVDDAITTWSNPFALASGRGWSWMGSLEDFLKEFKPI